jgi:predicted MPP superfamily phosphohydrolase
MFGRLLISAVTLMHVYVLWRAGSVPFLRQYVTRKKIVIGGVALWCLFFVGRIYGHDSAGALSTMLELAGMTWMAVLFLTTVPMLAVDILTGFGSFLPRLAPSLRGAALICGAMLSVTAMVQGMRPPAVDHFEVYLPGLPSRLDGTVIVGMSDLHIGATLDGKWLGKRVDQVLEERPDMIVLLGDIFEGHSLPTKEHVTTLKGLNAPMGVWAVLGNHEFHGRDDSIASTCHDASITVLRNEQAEVRPGLILAGVDDLTAHRRAGLHSDIVTRVLARPTKGATILLSHTPWSADLAAKAGAGLMLCGHTHGGQVWPFGHLVRRIYPLLAGRYNVDGMTVIVSRGAGTWGPRMRLWEPGEIIRVTLRAKKEEA